MCCGLSFIIWMFWSFYKTNLLNKHEIQCQIKNHKLPEIGTNFDTVDNVRSNLVHFPTEVCKYFFGSLLNYEFNLYWTFANILTPEQLRRYTWVAWKPEDIGNSTEIASKTTITSHFPTNSGSIWGLFLLRIELISRLKITETTNFPIVLTF